MLHLGRLIAHRAQQQINPFFGAEFSPAGAVLLQIKGGELNRRELIDPEGVFTLTFFIVLKTHVDLRPDSSREQPIKITDVVIGDVNIAMTEVCEFRPVLRINKPHLHLVDEGVLACFLHLALSFGAFIRPDVIVGQGVIDNLHAHLNRHLIAGGAVFAE